MAVTNIEDLNLDDITEDLLTEKAVDMGSSLGVDTREGSVYRDAAAGHITRTAEFFDNLSQLKEILSIFTCTGEILDEYLRQRGMTRQPDAETQATYKCFFVGADPVPGAVMIVDEYEFTVISQDKTDSTCWYIQSVDTGTDMNNFATGTAVIPDEDIDDLESCTLGDLVVPAVDIEEDDSARKRLLEAVSEDIEAGNSAQIHKWCMSIEGVGRAEVFPMEDGPGTVSAYITSTAGLTPSASVVKAVQDYVDPGANGEGEGVAPIGCKFKAKAVTNYSISVSGSIMCQPGTDTNAVSTEIAQKIKDYLKNIALNGKDIPGTTSRAVSINGIGALIMGTNGVRDYTGLELNGGSSNLSYTHKEVPFLDKNDLTYSVYSDT